MKVVASHVTDAYLLVDLLDCFSDSDREDAARNILDGAVSWTFFDEGKAVGVIGALVIHNHCLSVWTLLSKDIYKKPIEFHRKLKLKLDELMDVPDVERLQSLVDVGNDSAYKQNLALGFRFEGTLRKSGLDKQDQTLFGLVRGKDGGC